MPLNNFNPFLRYQVHSLVYSNSSPHQTQPVCLSKPEEKRRAAGKTTCQLIQPHANRSLTRNQSNIPTSPCHVVHLLITSYVFSEVIVDGLQILGRSRKMSFVDEKVVRQKLQYIFGEGWYKLKWSERGMGGRGR